MRIAACAANVVMLTWVVLAQGPSDVSVNLAIKGGQSQFRLGEPIPVELRFQSSAGGLYQVWINATTRRVRQALYDHFIAEPNQGTADPLTDIFDQVEGSFGDVMLRPVPFNSKPVTVDLLLNEWLSIRQPGHYRITAESRRVVRSGQLESNIPLHSNSVDIDVVSPEPGWAAEQLKNAVAVFERGELRQPAVGEPFDPGQYRARDEEVEQAARVMRFLETPEAAQALVRFYENGPFQAQQDLRAGLFGSPHRKAIMAAMEAALVSPDFPVTNTFLGTLTGFHQIERIGPTPLFAAKTSEEIKRWIDDVEAPRRPAAKLIEEEYFAKLAQALKNKRGRALAVSLDTVVSRGPQPPSAALVRALTDSFAALPEMTQQRLLTDDWPKLASPSMVQFLRSIASGSGPARDAALLRLQDLDPDAARGIAIARIRKGDVGQGPFGSSYRSLMTLPDRTLPELDDDLLSALQAGKPVVQLVARYASERILAPVRDWFTRTGCDSPLLAYLFRVDPAYAAGQVQAMRQSGPSRCTLNLSPNEYVLISSGLEEQVIKDLSSSDPLIVRSAQTLLGRAGSISARQPLMDAMVRFREKNTTDADSQGIEWGFIEALLEGSGWVPSQTDIDSVFATCSTDDCRKQVEGVRRMITPPILIEFLPQPNDLFYARIGPFSTATSGQFDAKIGQFDKGTKFYLAPYHEGTWYQSQLKETLQQKLAAAGMQLVDTPPRPPIGR